MTFSASQCSGQNADYILNEMPLAHAMQYQAMHLRFNGNTVVHPKHLQRLDSNKKLENIING